MRANDILKRFDELAVQWIPSIMGKKLDVLIKKVVAEIRGDVERAKSISRVTGLEHRETGAFVRSSKAMNLLSGSVEPDKNIMSMIQTELKNSSCSEVLGFMIRLVGDCDPVQGQELNNELVGHADQINGVIKWFPSMLPSKLKTVVHDHAQAMEWDPEKITGSVQELLRTDTRVSGEITQYLDRVDRDGTMVVMRVGDFYDDEEYQDTMSRVRTWCEKVMRLSTEPEHVAGAAIEALEQGMLHDEARGLNAEFQSVMPMIKRG